MLLLITLLMVLPLTVSATVTPTVPSPSDDATNVWVNTPSLSVLLNCTNGTQMNGTITLVATGDVLTITAQTNGTQTLTIASGNLPLTQSTTYQWWVNASDLDGWTNTSYNFTTGTASRMSENSDFDATEVLLFGLLATFVILGLVVFAWDVVKTGKLNVKTLMTFLVAVVVVVIALGFI